MRNFIKFVMSFLLTCVLFLSCDNPTLSGEDSNEVEGGKQKIQKADTGVLLNTRNVTPFNGYELLYTRKKATAISWCSDQDVGIFKRFTHHFADVTGLFNYVKNTGDYHMIGTNLSIVGDFQDLISGNFKNRDISIVYALEPTAIAYPVDYIFVWNDKGSGLPDDVSVWRPVPPSGYVAMGFYAHGKYSKPGLKKMVCVRRDLVNQCSLGNMIWKDKGSCADRDFSGWNAGNGLFIGSSNYSKPNLPAFTFNTKKVYYEPQPY